MNAALVIQLLTYLIEHQADVFSLIRTLEDVGVKVVEDISGPQKAEVLKGYIAVQTGLIADIEPLWQIVSPVVNGMVAKAKAKTATA